MTPFLRQCYESAAAAKNLASSLKKGALGVAPERHVNERVSLPIRIVLAWLDLDRGFSYQGAPWGHCLCHLQTDELN
jgi:hypothetical protein